MKNPSERKSDRLGEIEQLLLAHPEGLSQAEIARRLGVHRSTITRYLPNLPGPVYIDFLDGNKWKVDRQAYLVNVRFTLDEAMAIHLATRLLATRMERQNPHAASALRKLGTALNT
ncbi:MAG: helix-turn-helix domain-containing protein, partial [Anaerolineaceae bacterium]